MKEIEVVAAIIHSGKEYFATQRGYGEFEGMWEFPGGKMEAGESPEAALKREIKEELGCRQRSYRKIEMHLSTATTPEYWHSAIVFFRGANLSNI